MSIQHLPPSTGQWLLLPRPSQYCGQTETAETVVPLCANVQELMRLYTGEKKLSGIAATVTYESGIESGPCYFKSFGVCFLMFHVGHSMHSDPRCQKMPLKNMTSHLHSPQLVGEPGGRGRKRDHLDFHGDIDIREVTQDRVVISY